jgi:DNA-binding Xre family transcriptional regulator
MLSNGCANGSPTLTPTRAGSSLASPTGLSQKELAELTATTQSAIARLESGGRPPRIDTLLRIAEALDCELIVELRPRTQQRGSK